ncbi:MAG: hypothetical protein Q9181_000309 [Wetmoreana brouardii]
MSHYLSSFLVEPVVRQARRFSRPSHDEISPPPSNHQLSFEDRAGLHHEGRVSSSGAISWAENGLHLTIGRGDPDAAAITEIETLSPRSEGGELGIEPRDQGQHAPPSQRSATSQGDSPTQGNTADVQRADGQISSNPVYGVPESLRSTTSSLSDSVQLILEEDTLNALDSARTTHQNSRSASGHINAHGGDGLLPADDGMGLMRKRIAAIQRTDSSSAEKARLVHQLMTEQYSSSQSNLQASHLSRARSPASLTSHERPFTPASLHSVDNNMQCASPPTPSSSVADANNPFHLSPEDMKPTFYHKPIHSQPNAEFESRAADRLLEDGGEEPKPLGCLHYKRNIKLQCSACYRWYTCRFCHDEAEDHSLNRRETKYMLCMLCGCAQPASEECTQCGECSARYYCSVCKLWDDDPGKSIYHCNDCGICRVGQGLGKDFYHCKVRPALRLQSTNGCALT